MIKYNDMDKDFDFDRVGKQMPYTVPDGFFAGMEAHILAEVNATRTKATRRRRRWAWMVTGGLTAVAASLVFALLPFTYAGGDVGASYSDVEQAFGNLSNEDRAYMLSVYQDDVFMKEAGAL